MAIHHLTEEIVFPPAEEAEPDGLLAVGGDLSVERLLEAYRHGIFPWYNKDEPILWWCPHPRFVLFPSELKVSKSMQQLLKRDTFTFTINKAFTTVIDNCKTAGRKGQDGTWISDNIKRAYIKMHEVGYAHSAEAWINGELAGGLYGIRLGDVFFGESMFSNQSNASKFSFINYVQTLREEGVQLIDCQVYTGHLESLGARMIDRSLFISYLKNK